MSTSEQPPTPQQPVELRDVLDGLAAESYGHTGTSGPPFEGVDCNKILEQLHTVQPHEAKDGKAFFKTYGNKWEALSTQQRNRTLIYWLTQLTEEVRQRLLTAIRGDLSIEAEKENGRQIMTTKHDKARILHLRADPGAASN